MLQTLVPCCFVIPFPFYNESLFLGVSGFCSFSRGISNLYLCFAKFCTFGKNSVFRFEYKSHTIYSVLEEPKAPLNRIKQTSDEILVETGWMNDLVLLFISLSTGLAITNIVQSCSGEFRRIIRTITRTGSCRYIVALSLSYHHERVTSFAILRICPDLISSRILNHYICSSSQRWG